MKACLSALLGLIGLIASSCCPGDEGCLDQVRVRAELAPDDPVTVELCFDDHCGSTEVGPYEEGTRGESFELDGGTEVRVGRKADHLALQIILWADDPVDGGVVTLRVFDLEGRVLVDGSGTTAYQRYGNPLCYQCQQAVLEL